MRCWEATRRQGGAARQTTRVCRWRQPAKPAADFALRRCRALTAGQQRPWQAAHPLAAIPRRASGADQIPRPGQGLRATVRKQTRAGSRWTAPQPPPCRGQSWKRVRHDGRAQLAWQPLRSRRLGKARPSALVGESSKATPWARRQGEVASAWTRRRCRRHRCRLPRIAMGWQASLQGAACVRRRPPASGWAGGRDRLRATCPSPGRHARRPPRCR